MSIKTRRFGASPILPLVAFLLLAATATGSDPTRKLDETAAPGEVKCGSCTTPVVPPPPPPSSPPPPSPELCPPPPYVKPPSPPKNPPSSDNGPPSSDNGPPSSDNGPPSPPSMNIMGPPGDLYPIDNNTSGATGRTGFAGVLPVLAGCAVLGLFVAV